MTKLQISRSGAVKWFAAAIAVTLAGGVVQWLPLALAGIVLGIAAMALTKAPPVTVGLSGLALAVTAIVAWWPSVGGIFFFVTCSTVTGIILYHSLYTRGGPVQMIALSTAVAMGVGVVGLLIPVVGAVLISAVLLAGAGTAVVVSIPRRERVELKAQM